MIPARWAYFLSLTTLVGVLTVRLLLLRRPETAAAERGLERLASGACVVLLGALGAQLTLQFLAFRDPWAPAGDEFRLLLGTEWGRRWLAALLAALVASVATAAARWGRGPIAAGGRVVRMLAALGLCLWPAMSGHAVALEDRVAVAVGLDALHVATAGSWLGTLGALLALDLFRAGGEPRGLWLSRLIPRFTPVALTSAALLVGTGVAGTFLRVPDPLPALGSPWGRLLLVKLALVVLVLALGAWNWRRGAREMRRGAGSDRLRRTATLEWTLAQAALLVTAILVGTTPPRG